MDGWSVYIVPCANPDGVIDGITKDGPGRTTIKEGIDLNRDFPDGFSVFTNPRNKTGNTSLIPSEAKALSSLVSGIKSQSNEMIVADMHGWENTTIGNSEIGGYFDREFGFSHKGGLNGQGYFSSWAQSIGAKATLVELPWPNSSQDIINRAYSQKVTNAFLNILKNKKVTDTMTGPVRYKAHVEGLGWQNYVSEGQIAGTVGQGLRVEAININRGGLPQGARIKYQVHVQDIGWMDYVYDGADAGTMGRSLRIEAMRMQLENAPAGYHIQYQVHVQDKGWMDPVSDGQLAGTTGESKRIEAFKINLVQDLIPRMNIDAPTEGQNLSSSLRVYGWSLHKGGVNQVKVYIDGNFVGNANTGGSRPDVKNAFPQYNNGEKSGFDYNLDINSIKPGSHNIRIDSIGNDGSTISQNRNFIVQDLSPRMNIDEPTEGQSLNSSLRVDGWSLHRGGVSQVKVYVDGNFISNANIGCSRPDIKNAFPQYNNADKSGFYYDIDINSIKSGSHNVRIDSIGNDGSTISQNRNFIIQDLSPRMNIDEPTEGQSLNSSLRVDGWSLHRGGVSQVKVYVDGNFISNANIGCSRPDVKSAFPQYNNAEKSGFYYDLDINSIKPGDHNIRIDSIGNDGSTISQNRNFTLIKVNGGVITNSNIDILTVLKTFPGTFMFGELLDGLKKLGISNISTFANNVVNTLINKLGLQYLTLDDIGYFVGGVLMAVDDNVFLGGAQKLVGLFGKTMPENNHYYMLGKTLTDGVFLALFLRTSVMAAADVVRALGTAAGSAALGMLTSETGIGFAVFETAAGVELVEAAAATCVSAIAGAGAAHSSGVLSQDAEKLAKTEGHSKGAAEAIEEVKAFVNKIKTDFGSELHLKQLSEDELIGGIAKIEDLDIRKQVMSNVRMYEGKLKYGAKTPEELQKAEADAFEAETAAAVSSKTKITEYQKKIIPPGESIAGEIDVATQKCIIEVTLGDSSKSAGEFTKYFKEPINPNGEREVILFAPGIGAENAARIESVGVKVIRDINKLIRYVGE